MDGRIGDDHGGTVLRGRRLDDLDVARAEFLDQRSRRSTFRSRVPELVVHEDGAETESLVLRWIIVVAAFS